MRRRRFAVLLPMLLVVGCGYNTIQSLDEQAQAAQQQIEVQLQRRADLVPNLVSAVKGFAQQELDVFTQVTQARAGVLGAIQKGDPAEMANADAQLTQAVSRILVVAEAYPQLKSDQNFLKLQDELIGTENRISTARQDYNAAVQSYNTYIRKFPAVLTSKVVGAKPRSYFQVTTPGAREVPTVDFSKPAPKPD